METIKNYDQNWPAQFEQEAAQIKDVLGEDIKDIQHVGSTSIPGMTAKPIIDIAVLVDSIEDREAFAQKLATLGYVYRPEMSSVERIFLRKGEPVQYHLSIAEPTHSFWQRQITFCEYLRTHPELVAEYNALKEKNIQDTPEADFADLSLSKAYNEGKGEFVNKVLRLAAEDQRS